MTPTARFWIDAKSCMHQIEPVGGSSGGPGAQLSQRTLRRSPWDRKALASIRRPAIWNSIAGMRPTAGLVSRSGVYGGWSEIAGPLGPMARTVREIWRFFFRQHGGLRCGGSAYSPWRWPCSKQLYEVSR